MSKFYGTLGSRFPFTSIIRDGFTKSSVLGGVLGRKWAKMGKFYVKSDSRFSFTSIIRPTTVFVLATYSPITHTPVYVRDCALLRTPPQAYRYDVT